MTTDKSTFEKCYGYKESKETPEQKATRTKFADKHGYQRHEEKDSQKVNRLMTSRLEKFVKAGNALETLARTPYKPTDNQRNYCVEIAQKTAEGVVSAMEGSKDEGEQIKVPE